MKKRAWTGPTFTQYKNDAKKRRTVAVDNFRKGLFANLGKIFPRLTNEKDIETLLQKVCKCIPIKKRNLRLLDKIEIELLAFEQCAAFLKEREIYLGESAAKRLMDDIGRLASFPESAIGVRARRVVKR